MKVLRKLEGSRKRKGSVLVLVTVGLIGMAGLSLSILAITNASNDSLRETRERTAAMYVAEAGIGQAIFDLQNGGTGVLGSAGAPINYEQSEIWVDVTDLGGGSRSLLATGLDKGVGYRIEVIVDKLTTTNFVWGAFGDVGLSMDSNAKVDSYDSSLGTYASQSVNGSGSSQYASANGNVGSNANVGMDSNTQVWGDAQPGPGGAWIPSGKADVTGSTSSASMATPLDPLDIPVIASTGDLIVGGSSSQTLAAGSYNFGDLSLDSNSDLLIYGPATIVVTNMSLASSAELIVDATDGPVEFFVMDDFVMNSNTLIASTTFTPADIAINLESNNVIDPDTSVDLDEVDFDSNAQIFGTLYAPNASVVINSNFELFGSLVAFQVDLDSNSFIHYDEALANSNSSGVDEYAMTLWRGAPFEEGSSSAWVSTMTYIHTHLPGKSSISLDQP